MSDHVGAYTGLYGDQCACREEPRRSSVNQVIKVIDIAWLEFDKPNPPRADAFVRPYPRATRLPVTRMRSLGSC